MDEQLTFRNKFPILGVSFILSFLLWTVLQISQPPGTKEGSTKVLAFNYEQSESRYVIPPLGDARVQVLGPQDELEGAADDVLRRNNVIVYVDLSDAHAGKGRYPLKLYAKPNSSFTFRLLDVEKELNIERRKLRRMPVAVDPVGEVDPDNTVAFDGASAQPAMVVISGATSAVDRVRRVRALLDLSTVEAKQPNPIPAEAVDEDDNKVDDVAISPQVITVTPLLAQAPNAKTVQISPLFKGRPADGFKVGTWTVEPSQVAVRTEDGDVPRLRSVQTGQINLEGLRTSTTFEVPLQLPAGVQTISAKKVRVSVLIERGVGNADNSR